jgi:c(7)-type cytochrome triheme protein
MKLKYTYYTLALCITGFLFLTAFYSNDDSKPGERNDRIIKFSHSLHTDLVTCAECHSKVVQSTSLKDRLMPDHDNCGDCHDVDDSDNCNTCHINDRYEPLVQKSPDLIFNHSFHIRQQNMDCQSCHKGFTEVNYGFQAVQPHPIMEDCYNCHADTKIAVNTCESCHISTADLLPQDHKNVAFMKTHKFSALNIDSNCIMCHDSNNNSCIECHLANNIITAENVPADFYQPYAPNNFIDGARMQKINRVHELNYRYTHGIDARSKRFDCQSCHQTETFCAACHQSEGRDFALGGIMPASHLKNDFIYGRVGPSGEHAILARRDIESCASCHDTNGADPTCIRCHQDPDGIRGTDPKTHSNNFMRSVRGDWHDTQGSVCYNCHTGSLSNAAGFGFCGYCHGSNN